MSLYHTDFYAWANQQAALLREGKFQAADIEHIAEEIESMGRSEKRELFSRLVILMMHLLKWQFQPMLRGHSWRATIKVQRRELVRHLADNPSLKSRLPDLIPEAYSDAILMADRETGLAESAFQTRCPWSFDDMVNPEMWPDGSSQVDVIPSG